MMAYTIKPDLAIVTDVCHDTTTPMIDPKKEWLSKCWSGPVMSRAPSVHNTLYDLITDIADKKKIPYQRMASSRWTGTDTDMFAYVGWGRPSALISLPLRYMHTTVEMVHRDDMENTIKLMYEVLLTIKKWQDFSYFSE
jgi:endoglucanase